MTPRPRRDGHVTFRRPALNVKLAGRRHCGLAAQIQHVGRRAGNVYLTPASAHVHDDVIVIALAFGNQSDWVRTVRAAGGTVRINGRTYRAPPPVPQP